ncbi:MAG: hypothetical protein ABI847_14255 [Anaerolineales bacterium]
MTISQPLTSLAPPRLRGRVLLLARVAWVVVGLAGTGFMLLSLITNVVLWSC